MAYDVLVIADGRTRLSVQRMQLMYLPCRLVDEWQHHIEAHTMLFQYLRSHRIAVIGEITGKDSGKVQVLAVVARQLIDMS